MFTGLIEEIGKVIQIERKQHYSTIQIQSDICVKDLKRGDSISVDGACLTVVDFNEKAFYADVTDETLKKTTLSLVKTGDYVNLERAMTADRRFGGHFVQGHVDGLAKITDIKPIGDTKELYIKLPDSLREYVVDKGSIALNGVSLTIAELSNSIIKIVLIPETLKSTNLGYKRPGDYLNVEVDILAKYVKKLLSRNSYSGPITLQKLKELGF